MDLRNADENSFSANRESIISFLAVIAGATIAIYLLYTQSKLNYPEYDDEDQVNEEPLLPPMFKDMYTCELAKYNAQHIDGRHLVALNRQIFDVSKAHEDFGPGGQYEQLSGTDITNFVKALAIRSGIPVEEHIKNWFAQLEAHFLIVGKLMHRVGRAKRIAASDESAYVNNRQSNHFSDSSPYPDNSALNTTSTEKTFERD